MNKWMALEDHIYFDEGTANIKVNLCNIHQKKIINIITLIFI